MSNKLHNLYHPQYYFSTLFHPHEFFFSKLCNQEKCEKYFLLNCDYKREPNEV